MARGSDHEPADGNARLADLVRRKRADRTLREIEPEVGVSRATLSRVENGAMPTPAGLVAICRWLGIDPAGILIAHAMGQLTARHGQAPRGLAP